jgi:hypothetical protein
MPRTAVLLAGLAFAAGADTATVYPLSSLPLAPPPTADDAHDATREGCGPAGLPASMLAPPALLGAEDFSARPCAEIVGGMAQFVLEARGPGGEDIEPLQLRVESLDLLEIRAVEMEVVRRLREQRAAGTAGRAAASSLRQTGEALTGVVTRPVESVIGFPAGMLRVFGRRATRYGRQASDLGERAYDAMSDEALFDASLRPRNAEPLPPEPEPWWQKGGGAAMTLGKRWLGYNAARRELGRELGIDPYSTNPWLGAEMDRLAWSALIGRRGVGFGLGQIGGAAGAVLGETTRVHRMVWEKPPEEVEAWNVARLAPLACRADVQDAFFDNARYSPTLQTQAVDALLELAPQGGCETFLGLAASVEREAEARFVVDALQLLVAARPRFPTRFEIFGEALVLRDGEERLWLALPVDLLQWTPETAEFFADPALASVTDKRLLLSRDASARARAALLASGWAVVEQSIGPAREFSARQPRADAGF